MSIDSVVNVNVVLQGQAISQAGFGTVLVLTDEGDWPAGISSSHIRSYSTLKEMTDEGWSTGSAAYKAASVMASQKLPPSVWKIGKSTAPVAKEVEVEITGSTDGDFTVTLGGVDFTYSASGVNANDIAANLQGLIDADPNYTASVLNHVITITGQAGDDYSASVTNSNGEMALSTTTPADGSVVRLVDNIMPVDSDWYGIVSTLRNASDIMGLAAFTESAKRLFVAQMTDANALIAGNTANVAYWLKGLSYARTAYLYHSSDAEYADAGWIAGKLAVNPDIQSTTWAHYTIKGAPVDSLTSAQQNALEDNNGNYYVLLGGSGSTYKGTCADGTFIDNVLAADWYRIRLIEAHQATFTEYSNAGRKIPYTDAGIAIIAADVRTVTTRGISAGHFLKRTESDTETASPKYTLPSRSEVSSADVSNRTYSYQVEVALAGAIHSLTVTAYLPLT